METGRKIRLAVFDIDGTLRTARDPWAHLHEHLGFSRQAREHHASFEAGAIDYRGWVDRDAALWKGLGRDAILSSLRSNPVKAGAAELLAWFRLRGIPMIGISTGLDLFNELVGREFGFRFIRSNELLFSDDGTCLGEVRIRVREDGKGAVLDAALRELGVPGESAVAFGDGGADIQLFERVGLSFAVHSARENVRAAASHCVDEPRLDAALAHLERYESCRPSLA